METKSKLINYEINYINLYFLKYKKNELISVVIYVFFLLIFLVNKYTDTNKVCYQIIINPIIFLINFGFECK